MERWGLRDWTLVIAALLAVASFLVGAINTVTQVRLTERTRSTQAALDSFIRMQALVDAQQNATTDHIHQRQSDVRERLSVIEDRVRNEGGG